MPPVCDRQILVRIALGQAFSKTQVKGHLALTLKWGNCMDRFWWTLQNVPYGPGLWQKNFPKIINRKDEIELIVSYKLKQAPGMSTSHTLQLPSGQKVINTMNPRLTKAKHNQSCGLSVITKESADIFI